MASESKAKKVLYKTTRFNFAEMAKKHSIAPESDSGGVVGPYTKGQLPYVFDQAFSMKVGQIKGLLKSPYGFHIILLDKKIGAVKPNLDKSRSQVTKRLKSLKLKETYNHIIQTAMDEITISYR